MASSSKKPSARHQDQWQRQVRREVDPMFGLPLLCLPKGTLIYRAVPAAISDRSLAAAPVKIERPKQKTPAWRQQRLGWAGSFHVAAEYTATAFTTFDFNSTSNRVSKNTPAQVGKVLVLETTRPLCLINFNRCDDLAKMREVLKTRMEKIGGDVFDKKTRLSVLDALDDVAQCRDTFYFGDDSREKGVMLRYSNLADDQYFSQALCTLGVDGWANFGIDCLRKGVETPATCWWHDELMFCNPARDWRKTGYEVRAVCNHKYWVLTRDGNVVNDRFAPNQDYMALPTCGTVWRASKKKSDAFLQTPQWRAVVEKGIENQRNTYKETKKT